MKKRSSLSSGLIAVVISACMAGTLHAQLVRQSVTLQPGWNAVYVSVSSETSAGALFKEWPVQSVSAYRAAEALGTAQLPGGFSGEYEANAPFGVWTREVPAASTLRFFPADTVLVCFNTNSTPFSVNLVGRPGAPRIAWRTSGSGANRYNYIGVHLNGPVSVTDYFGGADIIQPVLKFGGRKESTPAVYNPQRGSMPWKLSDGDVVLVRTEKISDWSGPLYVSPRLGIHFGTDEQVASVDIRNDGTVAKKVEVSFVPSIENMPFPELMWKDQSGIFSTSRWERADGVYVKTLETGEVWRVGLAVDRTQFSVGASEKLFGGIFKIIEKGGTQMKVELPCTVQVGEIKQGYEKPSGTWPAGLWEGVAELNRVSRWESSDKSVEMESAGGKMKIRLLIHVDDHGETTLLQRATIGAVKDGDGVSEQVLFGPWAQIPSEYGVTVRISCAALPTDLGILHSRSGTFFGGTEDPLIFAYTIGEASPSNPFYHPLHPQFDGLKGDFETPAPSGESITNYVGSVKPERFPIKGEISLSFDQAPDTPWEPAETATGSVRWTYDGIRREGPLHADGTFTLSRISRIGKIRK